MLLSPIKNDEGLTLNIVEDSISKVLNWILTEWGQVLDVKLREHLELLLSLLDVIVNIVQDVFNVIGRWLKLVRTYLFLVIYKLNQRRIL